MLLSFSCNGDQCPHNKTLATKVAKHVLAAHRELTDLIEIRDAAGARRLMDDHVKMIRARRVAESRRSNVKDRKTHDRCC
jgi:GntR family transcriptional repressor for pyruvate dehydrogenase complex